MKNRQESEIPDTQFNVVVKHTTQCFPSAVLVSYSPGHHALPVAVEPKPTVAFGISPVLVSYNPGHHALPVAVEPKPTVAFGTSAVRGR